MAAALGLAGCGTSMGHHLGPVVGKQAQPPPVHFAGTPPVPTYRHHNLERCQPANLSLESTVDGLFACSIPSTPAPQNPNGILTGSFCSGGFTYARAHVTTPMRVRISHSNPHLTVVLRADNASTSIQLPPAQSCVVVDLDPGVWTLTATRAATGPPLGDFAVEFKQITQP